MYLKYLKDDNVKSAFISQIILISKLSNLNIGNFLKNNNNDYSSLSFLGNFLKNINNEILEIFFSKYSNAISSADIKSKKICYFELFNYFAAISKDLKEDVVNKIKNVYFVYIKNKLNIDNNISKEIFNFIYSTESVYKSLNDLINMG